MERMRDKKPIHIINPQHANWGVPRVTLHGMWRT